MSRGVFDRLRQRAMGGLRAAYQPPPPCAHPEGSNPMVTDHPWWREMRCLGCGRLIATYIERDGVWRLEHYHLPEEDAVSCVP